MLKTITAALFCILFFLHSSATDYDDAWKAINQKRYSDARALLEKAIQNPATSLDAYISLVYLQAYQGKEDEIKGLSQKIEQCSGKNAYLYSLWFNGSVLGGYSKKKSYQMEILNSILNGNDFNGSIKSAAHYVKAMHYALSNDHQKAIQEYALMGALEDWQLVGPFENLSGSGFNAQKEPLLYADNKTKFKGSNDIEINWFTPTSMNREGWIFTHPHIPQSTAIVFAQTFVNAPEDMKVLLNYGGNGSVKVWVNDALILSESKERVTELDYYKNYCKLKKGYNRILVQLGYTGSSTPNFIIRLTDENMNPVKGITSTSQLQTYQKVSEEGQPQSLKHFAEKYFEDKVKSEPGNLVNYILLSEAYLRDLKTTESREVIEQALKLMPSNPLLRFELIQCLLKTENRTVLMQEVEWMKENDPDSYLTHQIKISNEIKEEKYTEANEELDKMISLYGDDENTMQLKASILGKTEKIDDLVKLVEKGYAQYPENTSFLEMMFKVNKLLKKDSKAALSIYEKYLKSNYNHSVQVQLAEEYKDQGMNDKYLALLEKNASEFNYDPSCYQDLSNYYFEKQDFKKSLLYAENTIELASFSGRYWYNKAKILDQMNNKDEAISTYKKAIYYDRTNYDARKRLNELQKKPDLIKLLPETDVYALIKKSGQDKEHDFSYLLDEKGTVIYDVGASESYITYVAKIYTQKGIDTWKEINVPYNDNTQTLLIEKSEVVKANGSKVPAERNDNQLVFTGLEAGDAIYVKYRIQNYSKGRLGKEYWDRFVFNSFVPSSLARYTLVVPKNIAFNSKITNSDIKPDVKAIEDFNVYTWEFKDQAPLKSEPVMPTLNDAGIVLHISTIKSWSDVANWYSDLSFQDLQTNYELTNLYNQIFSNAGKLSTYDKAKLIYNYIVTNIRYSSVSFRQSDLVPQDISKIISTKLGDCKDLSSLYVALLNKAGIKANLVLIDTRDNGVYDMILPSIDFNHCITKIYIDGKEYFVELTDSELPFTSLPNNLHGALSLVIPAHGEKSAEELKPLNPGNHTSEKVIRYVNLSVAGRDEKLKVKAIRYGNLTSPWREEYSTLSADKQKEHYEQYLSKDYKNPIKLESLSFDGLNELKDSLITDYTYVAKNELIEAGSMKMIKVPFIDLIATLENFSAEKRDFPFEYWSYENTDNYQTIISIELEPGQKFIEIPQNQSFSFGGCTYSLKYIKEGNKLKVYRSAKLVRNNVLAKDYPALKKFFTDIVEAESKYIVIK